MADAAVVQQIGKFPRSANQVLISGRIISSTMISGQNGKFFSSLVRLPAPDPFTSPQTVDITSSARLGNKDEDIEVICSVGGYQRSFDWTNRETGEVSRRQTADIRLTVVGV